MSLLKDASKTMTLSPRLREKHACFCAWKNNQTALDCREAHLLQIINYELTAISMQKNWAMYDYFHIRTSMWANDYTGILDMLQKIWRGQRRCFELWSPRLGNLQSWIPVSKLSPNCQWGISLLLLETFWLSANSWGISLINSQQSLLQEQRYDGWSSHLFHPTCWTLAGDEVLLCLEKTFSSVQSSSRTENIVLVEHFEILKL
jgi:hypothetical protein